MISDLLSLGGSMSKIIREKPAATAEARGQSACRSSERNRGRASPSESSSQFGAIAHAEFAVDGGDVRFDGPHTDEKGRGRVAIGRAGCDEIGDAPLGCGQVRIGAARSGALFQFPFDLYHQRTMADGVSEPG